MVWLLDAPYNSIYRCIIKSYRSFYFSGYIISFANRVVVRILRSSSMADFSLLCVLGIVRNCGEKVCYRKCQSVNRRRVSSSLSRRPNNRIEFVRFAHRTLVPRAAHAER